VSGGGPEPRGPDPTRDPVTRTLPPAADTDLTALVRAEVHRQLLRRRRDRERAGDIFAQCVYGRHACRCTLRGEGFRCPFAFAEDAR
jgi:hypothetical protein